MSDRFEMTGEGVALLTQESVTDGLQAFQKQLLLLRKANGPSNGSLFSQTASAAGSPRQLP